MTISCVEMQGFFYEFQAILSATLIKKKIKFSSYIRNFRMEQLRIHIWLMAFSYMVKYLRISSYIRKPSLLYDFATAQFGISLYLRKIWFSVLSVYCVSGCLLSLSSHHSCFHPSLPECDIVYVDTWDPGLKTLRLSPWRPNLHTKWGREGNGMWGRRPAQRKTNI